MRTRLNILFVVVPLLAVVVLLGFAAAPARADEATPTTSTVVIVDPPPPTPPTTVPPEDTSTTTSTVVVVVDPPPSTTTTTLLSTTPSTEPVHHTIATVLRARGRRHAPSVATPMPRSRVIVDRRPVTPALVTPARLNLAGAAMLVGIFTALVLWRRARWTAPQDEA